MTYSRIEKEKTILYLGLNPPRALSNTTIIHYPVIRIVPRSFHSPEIIQAFHYWSKYTHIILTSRNAVQILFAFLPFFGYDAVSLQKKQVIAIGKKTAEVLSLKGIRAAMISQEETSEGIVTELKKMGSQNWCDAFFFWPHSALSRQIISDYLTFEKIPYRACVLYDTYAQRPEPIPNLDEIDEIVFTSPSCVDAFLQIFGTLRRDKILTSIGPITQQYITSLPN